MAKVSDILKNLFFILLLLQFAPPLIRNIRHQYGQLFEVRTKVGLLPIKGIIASSQFYTKALKKFFEDNSIKAILLFIESPGGAAGSSEAIAHEIITLSKEYPKPIIVFSENICTSGAFYIAVCANWLIVCPSTLVGSVGAYIPFQFKLKEFLESHKIYYEAIQAGDYKLATDPFVDLTPEQKKMLQSVAQSSYDNFVQHVTTVRPILNIKEHKAWGDGKIFSGIQAQQMHLVDQVGSWSDALKKLKETALIEDKIEWVKPEQQQSFWNIFKPQEQYNEEETVSTSSNSPLERLVFYGLEKFLGTMYNI